MTDQPNISGVPETFQAAPEPSLPPEVRAALDGVKDLADDEPVEEPDFPERIDFGNGLFASLRHPSELTAGDVKAAVRGMERGSKFDFSDALAPAVIDAWNLQDANGKPLKPPSLDPASLDRLKPAQYMKLSTELWRYVQVLFPDPPVA